MRDRARVRPFGTIWMLLRLANAERSPLSRDIPGQAHCLLRVCAAPMPLKMVSYADGVPPPWLKTQSSGGTGDLKEGPVHRSFRPGFHDVRGAARWLLGSCYPAGDSSQRRPYA